jgi:murein L,D-transpeptidase YcbB/YkuD
MHQPTPQRVMLKTSVPVFVVYTTVIARADGKTLFYEDLYGHDRVLAARLGRWYPYIK